jgi:2,7-dihydroxy-5-methyl-1-naphthoate 7-O-methyltransferase
MSLWELSDLSTPWSIHVVATLHVAQHIAAGHTDITALAEACGADRAYLHRVLQHLAAKGIFEEPSPGRFALNDAARPLLEEGASLGMNLDAFGGRMANAWSTMLSAVRTGRPAYDERFGRTFWDDLDAHPAIAADFDALMGPSGHGLPDPEILPNPADWESIRSVVDVGGGTGALLAEILRAHPHVTGSLVDLPRTVATSRSIFHEAGVADRVTVTAQSFFDPLPPGHDLYVLKSVISDWPDPEAVAILRRCAEAAQPSGRVVVFNGAGPGEEGSPSLLMMVLVGGRDRSFDELCTLAREAGLNYRAFARQRCGRGVVEFTS